jgi:prepilin-type N-terminal cleavage/methylation domain-containing protein
MANKTGFTLVELMVSTGILTVVAVLSFIALSSSYSAESVIEAQTSLQTELRGVLSTMAQELELAYAPPRPGDETNAPQGVAPIQVDPVSKSITFYKPAPANVLTGYEWQGPITYSFQNEDANGNNILDPGEDTNGDGVLTRRIVRTFQSQTVPVGAANSLSNVSFALLESSNPTDDRRLRLEITLEANRWVGPGQRSLAKQRVQTQIRLLN